MSQLGVVTHPRFSGLFWTQLIGAFTDNLFKNALNVLVLFKAWTLSPQWNAESLTYIASAIFMAPFFFCSATAGQLSDKLEKSRLVRRLKTAEVFFSFLALYGLWSKNVAILFVVLLFFAIQSAFFGPIKYGILPQLLDESQLVAGNALVETATNLAILAGTILAGILLHNYDPVVLGVLLVIISLSGYLCSRTIPECPSQEPDLAVEWNPILPIWKILGLLRERTSVFNSVLGISWFWLLGVCILTMLQVYAKDVLTIDETGNSFLLGVFSIGVGVGSLWCEKLSRGRLELGLVPLGSLGISLFCMDLFWIGQPWMLESQPLTLSAFLHRGPTWRILFDLFALSVASGFFIVPLYTLIQQRARPEIRSRVIAGNNIINALFMVGGVLTIGWLRHRGWSIPELFALLSVTNILVAGYIYTLIPEFTLRFVAFVMTHILYRCRIVGEEKIPEEGPVVLVCNHVTFIDWLIVAAALRRPPHFVMWYAYYRLPLLRFLFRDAGCIPISNHHVKPHITAAAFMKMKEVLERGEVLCIFPEGRITKDGEMCAFRPGVERTVEETPAPVVPMALRGLWGSNFSRFPGGFFQRFLVRPLRSPIELVIGEVIPPDQVKAEVLRERVLELRGDRL